MDKNTFHQTVRLNMGKTVLATIQKTFVWNVRTFFAQNLVGTQKQKSEKLRNHKIISEHGESGFDNLSVQFLAKVRKHFNHNPTKKEIEFFLKVFFIK